MAGRGPAAWWARHRIIAEDEDGIEMESSEVQAVLAANEAFYRAFNQRDMQAMEAVWASSVPVSCLHPGWNVLLGREDVLESWRNILANPQQPRIVSGGAGVTVLGNVAIVVGRELVAASPLACTNVFVREQSDWKLVHHQSGPVNAQGA